MKHIEYYEADDGTRFDCMWECEAYETNKKFPDIDKHLKGLDEDKKPMKIGAVDDESWQNEIIYYIIYDAIGYDYLKICRDYTGIGHPIKAYKDVKYPIVLEYDGEEYGEDVVANFNTHKNKYDAIMKEV